MAGACSQASGHAFSPDAGHFYNGLGHAFVDPAQILLLLALGLIAARGDTRIARWVLLGVPLVSLLASIAVRVPEWLVPAELTLLACAAVTGLMVALDRSVARLAILAVALAAGVGLGIMNGAELAREAWLVPRLYLSGAALGIFFLLVLVFVAGSRLLEFGLGWVSVALRVLGSWCVAGAAMLLTLALTGV